MNNGREEWVVILHSHFIMDFSLLSPLEFFADPKDGDGRNNKPPNSVFTAADSLHI